MSQHPESAHRVGGPWWLTLTGAYNLMPCRHQQETKARHGSYLFHTNSNNSAQKCDRNKIVSLMSMTSPQSEGCKHNKFALLRNLSMMAVNIACFTYFTQCIMRWIFCFHQHVWYRRHWRMLGSNLTAANVALLTIFRFPI